jgi:class 3 adenylate cyclase
VVKFSREQIACWLLAALALSIAGLALADAWRQIGQPYPGFAVMDNLLVGVGGAEPRGLRPFDVVRVLNGQVLTSGREIQAEAKRQPPGTTFHYMLLRRGQLVEVDIPTRVITPGDFGRYALEGLLPALLLLALGAIVITLRPAMTQSRLFFAFCVIWSLTHSTVLDAHLTYHFGRLFLAAWAFSPAVFAHLALTFPQRRAITERRPRVVWLPYALSAVIAALLQLSLDPDRQLLVPAIGAVYWSAGLIMLILSLVRTSVAGATALIRQRARVLMAGFSAGYLLPVLGTATEAVFRISIPYLNHLWKLTILFPLAVAYAMIRYNLFDLRALVRIGTIYSAVTGFVVLVYAGSIALLNVSLSRLELSVSPLIPAALVSLVVVLFLNPVYARTQALVDRVFFRQRYDARRSIERLSEAMITILDLGRLAQLITETIDDLFRPARVALLVYEEGRREYRRVGPTDRSAAVSEDSPLLRCLARHRIPLTPERLREDPSLSAFSAPCLAQLEKLKADLVVPALFRDRVIALVALGPKRSGAAYTSEDLRLLRLLLNQSSVAMENAKAYAALQAALRRVEILESIRSSLSKFVPKTVQELIEQAPEAPALAKRDVDVSVLFVDIVGYTRLSERLDVGKVNYLVERYFGAFLDEILGNGGDVSEMAGDGLMVIFQDSDSNRHAEAAVLTAIGIMDRARRISAELAAVAEPITLRIGVNSGMAAVGATKIEGTAGTRWTYTASGPVTNVAARLAALGDGDSILIGPETRRRVDEGFPVEDLGEQQLRNVEEPVRVFRLRASGPDQRPVSGQPRPTGRGPAQPAWPGA